jgi:hypothetical protein
MTHNPDEVERPSEMLVNFYQTTWRYNPEDSHFHTRLHENLEFYIEKAYDMTWYFRIL